MLHRYLPEQIENKILPHQLAKTLPAKPKKPTRIFSLLIIMIAFTGIVILIKTIFLTRCLDRYLFPTPNFRLARICTKLSSSPAEFQFVTSLESITVSTSSLFQTLVSNQKTSLMDITRIQNSLTSLNETTSVLAAQNFHPKITQLHRVTSQLQAASPLLPQLLAINSKKSFLILIQDSTELRSAGGYIDTLVYITLENSKIISTRYFNSFMLNAWQKKLPDPDFPTTAKQLSALFFRSTSLPVDYIIAVNLNTLNHLFPNLVTDYLNTLTQSGSNNLYFQNLISNLISQFPSFPPPSQIKTIYHLLTQLQLRQIYLWPSIPAWDGSLSPPSSNFIIPLENHLGLNKSSAYTTHTVLISQTVTPDRLVTKYQLSLKNTGPSSVWPAGTLKNHFQLFLPPDAQVDFVSTRYSPLPRSGFIAISLNIDIPPGENRELIVKYTQPLSLPQSHFLFSYIPQPGLLNHTLTYTLNYPMNWSITTRLAPAVAHAGFLQYNSPSPNPFILDLNL